MNENELILPALVLNDYEGKYYATWVMEGKKTLETRMRRFNYVGDLLICCGNKSVTGNKGKALCVIHFGKSRLMEDTDQAAACIENADGRIVYPLTNLRQLSFKFTFTDHVVKKNFQGIFSVKIPSGVQIINL